MSDWGERSNKAVVESFISGFHLKVQSFSFEKFNLEAQKGSLGLMQPCTLHSPEDFLEKLNSLFSQDRRGQSITSFWVTFPVLPSINQQHRLFFSSKKSKYPCGLPPTQSVLPLIADSGGQNNFQSPCHPVENGKNDNITYKTQQNTDDNNWNWKTEPQIISKFPNYLSPSPSHLS